MTALQHPAHQSITPAPGTYDIDASHAQVSFSARHLMVSKVRGRFGVTGGRIVVGENPENSSVVAEIDATSVSSGDAKRDEHLRSNDFFDTEHYPTITFRSTRVEDHGDGEFTLHGDLTVRDTTRPVALQGEYLGTEPSPFGDVRIGFSARTQVNRKDWGLEWNVALESGGILVGDKITLDIDLEAIKK
jgi:polyisoprenoid-binding protein YceI